MHFFFCTSVCNSIVLFILQCSNIPDSQQISTVNYCTRVFPHTVKATFITCVNNTYPCLHICFLYPVITAKSVMPLHLKPKQQTRQSETVLFHWRELCVSLPYLYCKCFHIHYMKSIVFPVVYSPFSLLC